MRSYSPSSSGPEYSWRKVSRDAGAGGAVGSSELAVAGGTMADTFSMDSTVAFVGAVILVWIARKLKKA